MIAFNSHCLNGILGKLYQILVRHHKEDKLITDSRWSWTVLSDFSFGLKPKVWPQYCPITLENNETNPWLAKTNPAVHLGVFFFNLMSYHYLSWIATSYRFVECPDASEVFVIHQHNNIVSFPIVVHFQYQSLHELILYTPHPPLESLLVTRRNGIIMPRDRCNAIKYS